MEKEIELISIQDLQEYENNAKQHPEWQVEKIAKSIKAFGFNDPIGIDEDNLILEGHGRYLAAKMLNMQEVPCIRVTGLDENEKRAYIIAHNKTSLDTSFDLDKLEYEINALQVEGIDVDDIGFNEEEINALFKEESMNTLDIGEVEDEEESTEVGYICPCCKHKGKKSEFLEVDIDG